MAKCKVVGRTEPEVRRRFFLVLLICLPFGFCYSIKCHAEVLMFGVVFFVRFVYLFTFHFHMPWFID